MRKIGIIFFLLLILLFIIPVILLKSCDNNNDEIKIDGDITIRVYNAQNGKIIEMNLEEYILGVVAGEMPASFHIEALKAQCLAARTYTLLRMRDFGGKGCSEHPDADICTDSTHCQAYKDPKVIKKDIDKLKKAVLETKNQIIVYQNQMIDAVFHSTSGGRTENSEDVWINKVPYLRSVISEYEEHAPKLITKKEISVDVFISKIKELDNSIVINKKNISKEIKILERSEGGRITKILIGDKILKGTDIKNKLELNSSNFDYSIKNNVIAFTVIGYGHGIGMSQYGADGMAQKGYDYKQIVKHYYQGVEVVNIEQFRINNGTLTMK